jgi:hypothetical protein
MRHVASLCRRYAHEIVALPGSRLAAAIVGVGPAVPIGHRTAPLGSRFSQFWKQPVDPVLVIATRDLPYLITVYFYSPLRQHHYTNALEA